MLLLAFGASAGARESADPKRAALEGHLSEGDRQIEAASFAGAAASFEEAVCEATVLSDPAALAKAWSGRGRAQWAVGREREVHRIRRARARACPEGLGDPDQEALLLNNVGLALYSTARHAEALDYYTLALDRSTSAATRALVLLNMGLVFRYQGRFEDSAVGPVRRRSRFGGPRASPGRRR